MSYMRDLKYGWDFMANAYGSEAVYDASSQFQQNIKANARIQIDNARIQKINDAIDELAKSINEHKYRNLGIEQFKGYVAEEWHAGTFNIDAAMKGSSHVASTLHENTLGSVDVSTNFGKNYSLKYYNDAGKAENAQAILNTETGTSKYQGQERLIAAEQLEDARDYAEKRFHKDQFNRPDVAQSHKDTASHLVGNISDGDGVESRNLSIKESKQIAKEAKKGEFDPEKHDFSKSALNDEIRIDYMHQALKAGLTAAEITALTQMVPELYKAIDYLIKNGEIDLDELRKSGKKIVTKSGEAFLRGSIAYSVEMAIQNGLLGEAIKQVSPTIVGVAVTVILGTVKDSILVASGHMTPREMGMKFVDTVAISSGYLVGVHVGGVVVQLLYPELPMVGYAIGSLLGCSFAVVYNIGKRNLISFCVDSGFTCFGLVEQDYQIPEEALKEMGVHTIPVPRTEVNRIDINRASTDVQVSTSGYETVKITVLKRGIIGVNRVGYVL